ncbi:Acyl-protein thioesterase 1 [Erysiphe necator]|uniref:Acyl-protein thioesterase 1 n=1 Tax=Uncinula necator TaxID=52586 RepID=A0A0B1PG62_UNCNE|nr:Acyl-protein thioesterase 1 [Erysiphe necator]KHJ35861.1 putative acyl-protein thioesterase 1 [Erysiphe necator]
MSCSKAPILFPAVRRHTATVIVAHGLGDSGEGWTFLAEKWRRENKFEEVKFIFPSAPLIPITVNMGITMPGWYDILHFSDLNASQDEKGILASRSYFHSLIATEISSGIPSERIVLGGFSQGAAMSLLSGITCSSKLAGIFGLSGYMLLHQKVEELIAQAGNINKDTKIFMGHGKDDQLVKAEWGSLTEQLLKNLGFKVDLRLYPDLAHASDPQEIDDLSKFLDDVIPPTEK